MKYLILIAALALAVGCGPHRVYSVGRPVELHFATPSHMQKKLHTSRNVYGLHIVKRDGRNQIWISTTEPNSLEIRGIVTTALHEFCHAIEHRDTAAAKVAVGILATESTAPPALIRTRNG